MADTRGVSAPCVSLDSIDWEDPQATAIDGFTVGEILEFVHDSVVRARCTECGEEVEVEPDARRYGCEGCRGFDTVTSPLVKLGLI